MADLAEAMGAVARQAKAQVEDLAFARPKIFHEKAQRFLAFGVGAERLALVIGHCLGELEVAVIVEDGIERDRSTSRGLQMREVFKAGAGAGGKLLRAGQVLAAMSKGDGIDATGWEHSSQQSTVGSQQSSPGCDCRLLTDCW